MQVTEISGFFLPTLKNPLASKNTVNTGLVAPASAYSTSYTAPGLPATNTTLGRYSDTYKVVPQID